jgi:carbon-monoxide dehydrogenase medium subunit
LRFEYHAPASVTELLDMLAHWKGRGRILAGGQTLMPLLNLRLSRPDHLIDINGVKGLDQFACSGGVSLGARCRQEQLERHPALPKVHPLLAEALPLIGDSAVRARGTVCGSLAAGAPAAELPALALTAGATLHIQRKRGCRDLAANDFYLSGGGTVLQSDELVAGVSFAEWQPGWGWAIEELRFTAMSFAAVGSVVVLVPSGNSCAKARITVFGQGVPPQRMTDAEAVLAGERLSARMLAFAIARVRAQLHAACVPGIPASYAEQVAAALVSRGLTRAAVRAGLALD